MDNNFKVRYSLACEEYYARQQMITSIAKLRPQYECVAEADDLQGLEHCIDVNPDLIFTDTHLSDGFTPQFLQSINCRVPMVFISSSNEYIPLTTGLNIVSYTLKPLSDSQLSNIINCFEAR